MRARLFQLVAATALLQAAILPASPASEGAPSDSSQLASAPADSAPARPEVILYYFHRTFRCQTCLSIEANIDEALHTHFTDALEDGRLLWRPANIEEPENIHFRDDFSLEFNSAVLVRLDGDQVVSWVNLEKVWDLLESKDAFLEYIRSQVAGALVHEPSVSE